MTRFFALVAMVAALTALPAWAVYKCEGPSSPPVYQDLPCRASERMTKLDANSVGDAAGAKSIAEDKAKSAAAIEKANRDRERQARELAARASMQKNVDAAIEADRKWRDAKDKVRVGMTSAELAALHSRFEWGGRRKTMESAGGIDEWMYFDDDHLTIHLHNSVVAFIHR